MLKNKYKDDYKETQRLDHKGRMVKDYYYVGQYYELLIDEETKKSTNKKNIFYLILFLLFWILAGLVNQDSSRTFWVLFPYFFILLPIIYFGYGAVNYWAQSVKMEKMAYDTSVGRMHRSGLGVIIWTAINVLLDIIYIILNINTAVIWKEIVYILFLLGIVVSGVMYAKFYDKNYTRLHIQ